MSTLSLRLTASKSRLLWRELGLAYRLIFVNLRNSEQKSADFMAINANAKVPVVVDRNDPGNEPVTLSESGAILLYLAEKFGRLLPTVPQMRARP